MKTEWRELMIDGKLQKVKVKICPPMPAKGALAGDVPFPVSDFETGFDQYALEDDYSENSRP